MYCRNTWGGVPGEQREEQRGRGGIVVPVVPDLPLPRLFVGAMKFGKAVTSEPDNAATLGTGRSSLDAQQQDNRRQHHDARGSTLGERDKRQARQACHRGRPGSGRHGAPDQVCNGMRRDLK